jgi:VWFA-related protein
MKTFLAALAIAAASQDVHRFRVDVRRVHVDVFVTRDGTSVADLQAENFEVYDDRERQEVKLVDVASVPQSFALLLDESGSISGRNRQLLKEAALGFARRLGAEGELTVLGFAERLSLRQPLRNDPAQIEESAYEIRGRGWTALNDALFLSMAYLRNGRGRPILAIFSDGMDNASWTSEDVVIQSARANEVVVYWVQAAVGDAFPRAGAGLVPGGRSAPASAMLGELTKLTGGRSVSASQVEAVHDALQEILSEVTARYLLVFSPREDAKPGWHELQVRVKGVGDVEVRARKGYYIPASD